MNYLLDTHILLWAADGRLPKKALEIIENDNNTLYFSPVSLWEIIIKNTLGRADFSVDAAALHKGLLAAGYKELPIRVSHSLAVAALPENHKDPFDRMLLAQATSENYTLVTADKIVGKYGDGIVLV